MSTTNANNIWGGFLAEKGLQPASISDGKTTVVFHIDPVQYNNKSQFLFAEAPTYAGYCRWDYGTVPNDWTLRGTTGNAGYAAAPGGLRDLEMFRPQQGRTSKLLMFAFPNRFRGVRYMKMNTFEDMTSQYGNLYIDFEINWKEYGQHQPPVPAVRLSGVPIVLPFPIGG